MNLKQFKQILAENTGHELLIQLETGLHVAPHFHVTEIGKVTKDFVDCGGTRRQTVSCVLQTLVANDIDHRLLADKLAGIVDKAGVLGLEDSLPVEAEIQTDTIGVYSFESATALNGKLVFTVASKKTACLAPEVCRLEVPPVAATLVDTVASGGESGC